MTRKPDLAAIVRSLLRQQRELLRMIEGLLPDPEPELPGFIPSREQRLILKALEAGPLTRRALARKTGLRPGQLLRDPGGIPELMEEGLIGYAARAGYYLASNPPPGASF